ncbi:winged helix-turn-helix domain-containing protein [Streptomyces sp. NPDC047097]|uniref:winged helix-turn-helix domain-containing protein n=1 Tax=Streptomyces sp. NPDC047097 TaxID=3155260 RepID=UPI0033C59D1E
MPNTRTLPVRSSAATAPAEPPLAPSPAAPFPGRRLRAVGRDEAVEAVDVSELLAPGATWLPAPPNAVPALPGQPPMVGYLVLVPAAGAEAPTGDPVGDGPVTIDGERRTALVDGRALDLTYLEFELLAHLVANPHRVHTRDQLVTTVWGYGHVGDGRTVDVHVARLRRKLGAEHRHTIQTVRRVGYKYTP